ncbi:hypothetical protein B0T20DRAFT_468050 [Sordaria brevicollis]|uniref:Uncharacterized protein n=1 Tax=Sordaria brevicollis TaxID=83679 RepID=A0AAE0PGU3_SORBR|nr:hypothetical protein B0T20DRAFT_468050 [Sordaria brevicollis]
MVAGEKKKRGNLYVFREGDQELGGVAPDNVDDEVEAVEDGDEDEDETGVRDMRAEAAPNRLANRRRPQPTNGRCLPSTDTRKLGYEKGQMYALVDTSLDTTTQLLREHRECEILRGRKKFINKRNNEEKKAEVQEILPSGSVDVLFHLLILTNHTTIRHGLIRLEDLHEISVVQQLLEIYKSHVRIPSFNAFVGRLLHPLRDQVPDDEVPVGVAVVVVNPHLFLTVVIVDVSLYSGIREVAADSFLLLEVVLVFMFHAVIGGFNIGVGVMLAGRLSAFRGGGGLLLLSEDVSSSKYLVIAPGVAIFVGDLGLWGYRTGVSTVEILSSCVTVAAKLTFNALYGWAADLMTEEVVRLLVTAPWMSVVVVDWRPVSLSLLFVGI